MLIIIIVPHTLSFDLSKCESVSLEIVIFQRLGPQGLGWQEFALEEEDIWNDQLSGNIRSILDKKCVVNSHERR
jgi:hypothetical protein